MKSPKTIAKEARVLKTSQKLPEAQVILEPEFAEQRLEETEAHDLRRAAGHSRKSERHTPEPRNQIKPPAQL